MHSLQQPRGLCRQRRLPFQRRNVPGFPPQHHRTSISIIIPRAEPDLDWEPEVKKKKGPLLAPPRSSFPPRPRQGGQPDGNEFVLSKALYFNKRRDVVFTLLLGGAAYWLLLNKVLITMDTKPPRDVPFALAGAQDLGPDDFVYYKTPGGHWVGVSEDSQGRHFMIDEGGDLYYDTGDPEIGIYVMDRQGDLFNFYNGPDGKRQITPVGNIADLRESQVGAIGGLQLDRPVRVVGFGDGREVPMPPNAGYTDKDGKFQPPGELVEGYVEEETPWWKNMGTPTPKYNIPRPLVDPADPTSYGSQIFKQIMDGKFDVEGVDTE